MIYADDLLKSIVGTITTDNLLSRSDRETLTSLCRGVDSETYITENQSKLALRLIGDNAKQLPQYTDEITQVVKLPVWRQPFRKIEIMKKIRITKTEDETSILVIESSHYLKHKGAWDMLREFSDVVAIDSNKSYMLPLTETNIALAVDTFGANGFEVDEAVKTYYDTIKSWDGDSYRNQFLLSNMAMPNFQRTIAEDIGDINSVPVHILADRSTRYKFKTEFEVKGSPILETICNRTSTNVWIDSKAHSMADLFSTLKELKRLPTVIVFDSWNDEQSYRMLKVLEEAFDAANITEVGIYFRLQNSEYGKQFNTIISERGYNKRLDNNLQVAVVQSGKLPKFFLKEPWQPMSSIALNSRMGFRHGKVSVYLKCTDLVIEYTEKPSLMDDINGNKIGYKR